MTNLIYSHVLNLPNMSAKMNVYNRATGRGAFVTLLLLAGALFVDVWLMGKLPVLRHGLGYAMLQIGLLAVFLTALRLIFRGGSPSAKD